MKETARTQAASAVPAPTGIEELDSLLGMGRRDFPNGAVVLVRGGPGAGKTTLALQILDRQLARTDVNTCGLFISLEEEPKAVLDRARHNFGLRLEKEGVAERNSSNWQRGKLFAPDSSWLNTWFGELDTREDVQGDRREGGNSLHSGRGCEGSSNRADAAIAVLLKALPRPSVDQTAEMKMLWVVIDSLNVLSTRTNVDRASGWLRYALFEFTQRFRQDVKDQNLIPDQNDQNFRVVFIHTAEYHGGASEDASVAGESFFCDVVIHLALEPVAGISRIDARDVSAAGYNIELQYHPGAAIERSVAERAQPGADIGTQGRIVVETRPFCRILKCRFGNHQFRRCSYEIVDAQGLRFNPVFPGDGEVLLFVENDRQRVDWDEFFTKDAPYQFPALRHDTFGRTSLQRVFATQRFRESPRRTDLSFATFDTYWIEWYRELYRRMLIGSGLDAIRPKEPRSQGSESKRKLFCRLLCRIDRLLAAEALDAIKVNELAASLALNEEFKDLELKLDDVIACLVRIVAEAKCEPSILQGVRVDELRLYGEYRSNLIDLSPHKGIHMNAGENMEFRAIPYNANVSFMVFRTDLLGRVTETQRADVVRKAVQLINDACTVLTRFAATHENDLEELRKASASSEGRYSLLDKLKKATGTSEETEMRVRQYLSTLAAGCDGLPWEVMIVLCEVMEWDLVLETRTFDTFLCCFLELVWASGGDLLIDEEYSVIDPPRTSLHLFYALFLLGQMVCRGVMPRQSTLEASVFGPAYSGSPSDKPGNRREWAFARHWYSTFVDLLTARARDAHAGYAWKPEGIAMGIMPLPPSFFAPASAAGGVSCWGEWYFTVLHGSENRKLAVELLNSLMSSQKITERALRNAALPTVSEFYEIYDDTPCLQIPDRQDLKLPETTYGQMREQIFKRARSRSGIFDYRHCMRRLHGLLEYVVATPQLDYTRLGARLVDTLRHIRNLRERELLLH